MRIEVVVDVKPILGEGPLWDVEQERLYWIDSFGGLVYLFWVGGHERWRENQLDREDWIFYIAAPFVSYLLLFAAAVAIGFQSMLGAAVLALTMILLLVTGIHNAWDLVVWLAQQRGK